MSTKTGEDHTLSYLGEVPEGRRGSFPSAISFPTPTLLQISLGNCKLPFCSASRLIPRFGLMIFTIARIDNIHNQPLTIMLCQMDIFHIFA